MKFKKPFLSLYIFVIPVLFLLTLNGFGFDGLYGQDSYEYLRYTKAIKTYFITGEHPGNYYWPVLYPFLGSLLSVILGSELISLQIISALSLSFCYLYLLKTIRILNPNHRLSEEYVIIFGILSPFFLKASLVIMSDVTTAMFISMTFYFFIKAYKDPKAKTYPIFFFATCALMTRYPSLFITLPIIVYSLHLVIKRRAIVDFLIALTISFFICIPFIFLQGKNIFDATSNHFLNSWSLSNYFKSSYVSIDGLQSYRFPNIIHSLYIFIHPGYIYIGILLCYFSFIKYKLSSTIPQKTIFISIILYLVFLTGIPFQSTRILGLLFPIILLFFYPSFLQLVELKRIKKNLRFLGLITLLLQFSLWSVTFRHPFKRAVFEKEMVEVLIPYQGKKMYSFDVDIALQGRGLNFEFKNLYLEQYVTFDSNALVLFHPTKFLKQWDNKNPVLNWNHLRNNYTLKVLEECPNGWKLYQIQIK